MDPDWTPHESATDLKLQRLRMFQLYLRLLTSFSMYPCLYYAQAVMTLIGRRRMWRQIWNCTVCVCSNIMTTLTYIHICVSMFILSANGVGTDWAPHYVGLIWDCSVCVNPNYDNVYLRLYKHPCYFMSNRCGPCLSATSGGVGFGSAPYVYVTVMATLTYA